jgi:hypothetical protein
MNTSPPLVGLKGLAAGTSANTVYPMRNCVLSASLLHPHRRQHNICGGIKNINKMHKKILNRKSLIFLSGF